MVGEVTGKWPAIGDKTSSGNPQPPVSPGQGMRRLGHLPRQDLVWTLPGFGPMTRITTSFGDVHAQALRERDRVRTKTGEFKPVVWIDRITLDDEFLRRHPDAMPILIRAGALGRGLPKHDVTLSPRQQIAPMANHLPPSAKTAADLLSRPGVFRKADPTVVYTQFHCGTPQTVMTEKMWVSVSP
jgi:hypothetical protein